MASTVREDSIKPKFATRGSQNSIGHFPKPKLCGEDYIAYRIALKTLGQLSAKAEKPETTEFDPKFEEVSFRVPEDYIEKFEDEENQQNPLVQIPCHANIISSMGLLAVIYTSKNTLLKAIHLLEVLEAVLSQQRLVLGPSHVDTLRTLNALGQINQKLGNFEEAITFYSRALELAPKNSSLRFTSHSNLGSLYFLKGDLNKADEIQTEAFQENDEAYRTAKNNGEKMSIASFNLALTKKELGFDDEAMKYLEIALDVSTKDAKLGKGHARTLAIIDTWREWKSECSRGNPVANLFGNFFSFATQRNQLGLNPLVNAINWALTSWQCNQLGLNPLATQRNRGSQQLLQLHNRTQLNMEEP